MKEIEVQRPSAKQLAKLRKGHPVRLVKGEGLILVVHPERFDLMSKTFSRGKARTVELSPEELMANMKTSPEAHQENQAVMENKDPSTFKVDKTEKVAEPKTSSTVVGSGLKKGTPRSAVSNAGGPRGIGTRTLIGAKDLVKHLGVVGAQSGQHYSPQLESALGNANANAMTASMGGMAIESAKQNFLVPQDKMVGQGLYSGQGLFAGKGLREHTSIGVGGNLLSRQVPALQSQPYSANFQLQFTLPPNFHRFNGGK